MLSPVQVPVFMRCLSRAALIMYRLAILTPAATHPVFGVIQQTSNGHTALSGHAAMGAMIFTAVSYGRMSSAFPVAGVAWLGLCSLVWLTRGSSEPLRIMDLS